MTYRLQGKNNAFIALPVCFSVRPCVASRDKLLSSRCPDFISSTFWRSHEDDDAWINTLLENLHTRPACWSFVVSGDFNALPNEVSDSLALSVAYVQDSSGAPSPSRWKGNRRIEFAAHTPDLNLVRCRYLDTVLSDHKVFAGHLEVTGHWQGACQLTSTPTLCKPHHVQDTEWRSKQEPEWLQVQIPSPSTTEQEWQEFHSQAERAAVTALGQFSAHRPPPQKRTKGSAPQVKAIARPTEVSYKSQKLRNLLGRCLELQQQQGRRLYNHTSAPWRWACCEDDRCKVIGGDRVSASRGVLALMYGDVTFDLGALFCWLLAMFTRGTSFLLWLWCSFFCDNFGMVPMSHFEAAYVGLKSGKVPSVALPSSPVDRGRQLWRTWLRAVRHGRVLWPAHLVGQGCSVDNRIFKHRLHRRGQRRAYVRLARENVVLLDSSRPCGQAISPTGGSQSVGRRGGLHLRGGACGKEEHLVEFLGTPSSTEVGDHGQPFVERLPPGFLRGGAGKAHRLLAGLQGLLKDIDGNEEQFEETDEEADLL